MRHLGKALAILLMAISRPVFADHAAAFETEIYKAILASLVNKEELEDFALWDRAISSSQIAREPFPHSAPRFQFVRALKGVTPKLELMLIYQNLETTDKDDHVIDMSLPRFEFSAPNGKQPSVLTSEQLQRVENTIGAPDSPKSLQLVGLSKIALGDKGDALVYAETTHVVERGYASPGFSTGYGFYLVSRRDKWRVQSYSSLWAGACLPFWKSAGPQPK